MNDSNQRPLFPYVEVQMSKIKEDNLKPNDETGCQHEELGWQVLFESVELKREKGESALIRALNLLEEQRIKRETIEQAFAFGIKLDNGMPDMEKLKDMQDQLNAIERPDRRKEWYNK